MHIHVCMYVGYIYACILYACTCMHVSVSRNQRYDNYTYEFTEGFKRVNTCVHTVCMHDAIYMHIYIHIYTLQVLIDKIRASHLDCDGTRGSCAELAQNQSLQLAVGEMLAFSLANVHVIGRSSGYARSGAWLSVVQPGMLFNVCMYVCMYVQYVISFFKNILRSFRCIRE